MRQKDRCIWVVMRRMLVMPIEPDLSVMLTLELSAALFTAGFRARESASASARWSESRGQGHREP